MTLRPILAVALAALALALFALLLMLAPGVGRVSPVSLDTGNWTAELPSIVVNVATVLVGALLAAKRPHNPIGWLLVLLGLGFLAHPVVVVVVASVPPDLAEASLFVHILAWVGNWVWVIGHAGALFLLLLFPTGRPPSRRWRPVVWLAAVVIVALFLMAATHQGPLEAAPSLQNPFGLPIPEFVVFIPLAAVQALELLACVSLVLRFVRSHGEERQQIKWVAFGTAVFAAYVLLNILFGLPRWTNAVGSAAPLAAITVAVLKYRLYDIDIVINRALVYGALTASLALVYVGCVVTLQYVFRALTGQETQLAVVASTLAIAALFNPLRRRVQAFVDHRFYRRKYDAANVLAAFNARLRDETDLDALTREVTTVVRETVQPTHVSLWLRLPSDAAARGTGEEMVR